MIFLVVVSPHRGGVHPANRRPFVYISGADQRAAVVNCPSGIRFVDPRPSFQQLHIRPLSFDLDSHLVVPCAET